MIYLASLLAVLGEGLTVVGGKLNCSLSTVVGHLHLSHKVSELHVVWVGVPLSRGQGQPVRRHLQNVEQLPGVRGDQVPQLSFVSQLWKVLNPNLILSGFGRDSNLAVMLD